jgi:DNA polymerase III alpha subunit
MARRASRTTRNREAVRIMTQAGYVELHTHSAFSFLRAGSSVEALVERAADLGMSALALTDHMTLAGVVRFQTACKEYGIRALVGCELDGADPQFGDAAEAAQFVALARHADGHARLCQLLTDANLTHPKAPIVPMQALIEAVTAPDAGLILLTGGREGALSRLLCGHQTVLAQETAARYAAVFGPDRVFVELQHDRLDGSLALVQRLADVAARAGLRVAASVTLE